MRDKCDHNWFCFVLRGRKDFCGVFFSFHPPKSRRLLQAVVHRRVQATAASWWWRWPGIAPWRSWASAGVAIRRLKEAWSNTDDLLSLGIACQRFVIAQVNVVHVTNLPALTTEVATGMEVMKLTNCVQKNLFYSTYRKHESSRQ